MRATVLKRVFKMEDALEEIYVDIYLFKSVFETLDRTKYMEDFNLAFDFAHDLLTDLLPKYNLQKLNQSVPYDPTTNALSPYCEHIGEAVLVVSYANRLRFKMLFDENFDYLLTSEIHIEQFALRFCKKVYVDGHVEQFLIICGFFVDLVAYLYYRTGKNFFCNMPLLFGDIFRYLLRETFYNEGGGWEEVKRKAKPWWHTYRNITYRQEADKTIVQRQIVDFHNPKYELSAKNFTVILNLLEYSRQFKTKDEYDFVPLEIPSDQNLGRVSPICNSKYNEPQDENTNVKSKRESSS